MASRVCWNCKTKSRQARVAAVVFVRELRITTSADIANGSWMAPFQCDNCQALSIGATPYQKYVVENSDDATGYMDSAEPAIQWLPERATSRAFPDVPPHIGAAASEADADHNLGNYRSAVIMARAVLEATAKDRKILDGKLHEKINELHKQGVIRTLVKDQAHEIRYFGNDMAHGDFVQPISAEESDEIIALMAEVLNEVYQAPAKLAALRAAREERKASAGESPPTA